MDYTSTAMSLDLDPALVGRHEQLGTLRGSLSDARAGRGGVAFLVGDPGLGKTRLCQEAAAEARREGMGVCFGHSSELTGQTPLRPLSEALSAAARDAGRPRRPELDPFDAALATLIPAWARPGADRVPPTSFEVLESAVRLLGALADEQGLLLVVEDLHWADAATLSVVEYLAGNLGTERVLCLCTAQADASSPVTALVERVEAGRLGPVLRLGHLAAPDIEALARGALEAEVLPRGLADLLLRGTAGAPLAALELLEAAVRSEALRKDGETLVFDPTVDLEPPSRVRRVVWKRLEQLGDDERSVVRALATLGSEATPSLLAEVVESSEPAVIASLRQAVAAGLLVPTGPGLQRNLFFPDALTAAAVITDLLPAELRLVARRALTAVERRWPELPAPWLRRTVQLALWCGDSGTAACHLLRLGRLAIEAADLGEAEVVLRRARELSRTAADTALTADITDALASALAATGKADLAREAGDALLEGDGPDRRARGELTLAQAARWAGDPVAARRHLARAAELDGAPQEEVAVLEALVAVDAAEPDARALAEQSLPDRPDAPDAECQALLAVARAALPADFQGACAALDRALNLASGLQLRLRSLEAQAEVSVLHALGTADISHLVHACTAAGAAGAAGRQADLELQLCRQHQLRHELSEADDRLERCDRIARRHGLGLAPLAGVTRAIQHAIRHEPDDVERALDAVSDAMERPDVAALAWGEARAIASLLEEDRARALAALERAMAFARQSPASLTQPLVGLWVLVRAVEDPKDRSALTELMNAKLLWVRTSRGLAELARAILTGRAGHRVEAAAALLAGDAYLKSAPWYRHYGLRLVAECALRDGWGSPVPWLREALAFFEREDRPAVVAACRRLLVEAGGAVPRRGRGTSEVPPGLRSKGVTSREVDVLALVAAGRSNAEVADELYLSPHTVKTHVASLLRKTRLTGRADLALLAAEVLGTSGTDASTNAASTPPMAPIETSIDLPDGGVIELMTPVAELTGSRSPR